MGAVPTGAITRADAEHYSVAFPEVYRQAFTPHDAIGDIAIIEQLQDNSVKLVFADGGEGQPANLTWYLAGRSASLSVLLPMLQCMGVVVLEERPFTVTRADGMPVWIYQFKISPHQSIREEQDAAEREATAMRFADAVTAIWHGRVEIDRFNELVMRAGLTWQQVTVLRSYAKYLRQAGFPYSQSHIETVVNDNAGTARALVELFEALFDPEDAQSESRQKKRDASAAAAAVAVGIDALVSLDTDRVLRAFASMIQATLRTNYFVTEPGLGAQPGRAVDQAESRPDRRIAAAATEDTRSSCTRRGSRACTCGSATSPAAGCAGRTAARTSAPRSSAWSRRRPSRTPSSCPSAPRAASC